MLLVAIYTASRHSLFVSQDTRSDTVSQSSHAWSIPTPVIEALAGEFKGLVADLMVLEAGAQLGMETTKQEGGALRVEKKYDWDAIVRLFKSSQALDPYFQQTYMLAQGWLPWTAKRYDETFEILEKAKNHRPWDWHPAHLIGFNTYYFQNNPGEAGKIYLAEAKENPNAPTWLGIVGSRLAHKGGETTGAISLMESMLAEKDKNEPGYQEIFDRYEALKGVFLIEEAIKVYINKNGSRPKSLSDLITSGILIDLPRNPYDVDYCMDEVGAIFFDNVDCR